MTLIIFGDFFYRHWVMLFHHDLILFFTTHIILHCLVLDAYSLLLETLTATMAKNNNQKLSKKTVTSCQTRNKFYTLEAAVKTPSDAASVSFHKPSIESKLVGHVDAYEKKYSSTEKNSRNKVILSSSSGLHDGRLNSNEKKSNIYTYIHNNSKKKENKNHKELDLTPEHLEVTCVESNTVSDLSIPQVNQPSTNTNNHMLQGTISLQSNWPSMESHSFLDHEKTLVMIEQYVKEDLFHRLKFISSPEMIAFSWDAR